MQSIWGVLAQRRIGEDDQRLKLRQDLNQAMYYLKIKAWNRVLMWGLIGILCIIDYSCRFFVHDGLYRMQSYCSCLIIGFTGMIGFLLYRRLSVFQYSEIDTLKMLGMSNQAVFFVAAYQIRYMYFFVMSVFSIMNVFLIDASVIYMLILEAGVFWYIFIFLYFIKTWHYHRLKLGRAFYIIKRIAVLVSSLALFLIILLQKRLQVILRVKKSIPVFQEIFEQVTDFSNKPLGGIFVHIFIIGTEFLYLRFIRKHALFGEEETKVIGIPFWVPMRDILLKFRGKRIYQIVKVNYMLYCQNFNCFITKVFLGMIWFILIFYCKDEKLVYYIANVIIAMLSALIMYRVREDSCNLELYRAIGYDTKRMFIYHSISAFFYLYTFILLGMVYGVLARHLSCKEVCVLLLLMGYRTIFFVCFNFYYLFVRKIDMDSQIYEAYEFFTGTVLSITSFGIIVMLFFLGKLIKYHRSMEYRGEES